MIRNIEDLQHFNNTCGKYKYPVSKQDFDNTSFIAHVIEHTRSDTKPKPGDVIICKGPNVRYENGHMDLPPGDYSSICVSPYIPYAYAVDIEAKFSTSGGYWFSCEDINMFVKEAKTREKVFWTWGHRGAEDNGGIHFKAEVNVWSVFKESIY